MDEFRDNVNRGRKILSESKIIICSIVRDCAKNLKKNIPTINSICDIANEYHVIVYENDSVDETKKILQEWAANRKNIHISINTISKEPSIPSFSESTFFPYNSLQRIGKMANHRNKYLEYIAENELLSDYIIVVDLDVSKIDISGILNSLGTIQNWDVITANGLALSRRLKKRYFDTYALFECGMENIPQTSESLQNNQHKWGFLRKGMPLIKVYSAYGGLSIYRSNIIHGLMYKVFSNYDNQIEVRCEHYGLCKQIQEKGFSGIFINPNMVVKYRSITFSLILKEIKNLIKSK